MSLLAAGSGKMESDLALISNLWLANNGATTQPSSHYMQDKAREA